VYKIVFIFQGGGFVNGTMSYEEAKDFFHNFHKGELPEIFYTKNCMFRTENLMGAYIASDTHEKYLESLAKLARKQERMMGDGDSCKDNDE
jgi:hypothetical protein